MKLKHKANSIWAKHQIGLSQCYDLNAYSVGFDHTYGQTLSVT